MKSAHGLLALVVVLISTAPLGAQVVIGPGGVSFGGTLKAGRLKIGFGGFVPTYGYYPPLYPYGFGSRTTVLQIYSPPPVVIAPPVAPVLPRFNFVDEPVLRPGQEVPLIQAPPRDQPEPPLPGAPAGIFRPIRPEDRARALAPVPAAPPEKPKPPDKPPEKPKAEEKPKAKLPARLPRPPQPEADLKAENARQVALGKEAFAGQEYGRALARFRLAVAAAPDEPLAQFLLAHTFFAMGKYVEAVEAIEVGLRLHPDWPRARFAPLELYEPNVALYPEQLRRLEETLAKHPDDPILLFLYAYQLWFDGRKDEARPLFQRAAPLMRDRTLIDRFLQALPGAAII
jgi:hypothetical protein